MPVATAPQNKAQSKNGKNGQQQNATPPRPFRVGTQSHEEVNLDVTNTLGSSQVNLPVLEIPPAGYLRGLLILVEATSATNAATVAYNGLDMPFSALASITLEDTNSKPIIGPLSGHDLYVINKYGGYDFGADPKNSPVYTATTGTTTPSTFSFVLRVPVELVARDTLGSLPNKSGTNKFKLRMTLNTGANVYSTSPTNAVSVRVRVTQEDWWEPDMQDLKGRPLAQNPPAMQTTQYWTVGTYSLNSGDQRVQIQQGLGYLLRNMIFENRDTSNLRSSTTDGNWPDPASLQFEANVLFERIAALWKERIHRYWDFNGTETVSAVNARDYSVFPLPFNQDFGLIPGAESRRGYLATSDSSRLEFRGNFGAAASFRVLANYVAPARGDDAAITV